MTESDFWEKNFSGRKCRKSPFFSDFLGGFLHISLFIHTKTLLIAIPTIKHVSIVKKTDFWSRNCLKIAGTANFRRKTVFLEYLKLYWYFFIKFCTLMQNDNVQDVTEPYFWKKYFSCRKCRKYAGKTGLLAFFRDFIISFFWFFAQRCVLAKPKTWLSPIFEKFFFPAENAGNMPEIAVFADFFRDFSSYFVVFSHKTQKHY